MNFGWALKTSQRTMSRFKYAIFLPIVIVPSWGTIKKCMSGNGQLILVFINKNIGLKYLILLNSDTFHSRWKKGFSAGGPGNPDQCNL